MAPHTSFLLYPLSLRVFILKCFLTARRRPFSRVLSGWDFVGQRGESVYETVVITVDNRLLC